MPNLPGRVRIPLNYNVIDIAHQICLNDNRVSTYCVSTSVLHTAAYVLRTHDDARHRTKPRTHLPNLPGRVRIPFNHNTIIFKLCICLYENWAYTYCYSTACLLVYNEPLPAYYVRKMMPDNEVSQELMCLD